MTPLPDYHPYAQASDADLLEWAHSENPPYARMRTAAPWLRREAEIRAYLDGVIQGNIYRWRFGSLFAEKRQ
jgi:hypothetical protein